MYLGIITLPLIGGIITGVLGRHLGRRGGIWINVQSIIASTILSIVGYYEIAITGWSISIIIGQWIETGYLGVAWGINIDTLSISIYMPVLIVSSCVQIFSIDYMRGDGYNIRFYTYLSLFTFFMLVLISGDSMITIFIGWEGVGVCSYLLVGYWYKRIKANKAGMQALIVNRVGDWGITIGIITIWGIIGDLDQASILSLGSRIKTEWVTIITIWVLIGAMAKSAQLGLHVWLPSAMEGPTPVSALIHAATMVTAGVYLLIRLSPLLEYSSTGLIIISWLGALTAIIAGTIAVYQNDLKRVIAYSTMSQLGYMVLAIGGSQYGISAYHMVNHAY